MSIIKTFSVGEGDMFYIKHGSDNFTIIDCFLPEDETEKSIIVKELITESKEKAIKRFISTHPDEDHLRGLKYLDEYMPIVNFYCVDNSATEEGETVDFKHYCKLRDDTKKSYYIYKGCSRKWMNKHDKNDPNDHGSSGISILWPATNNEEYKKALQLAADGKAFNNLSPIIKYSVEDSVTALWMGDMESDFIEKIKECVDWPSIDILFAPHHGRKSGKVPSDVLKLLNPKIIVIGEAPSQYLDYYNGYNTLKQNSAGDITFNCVDEKVHVYIEKADYKYDTSFLLDDSQSDKFGNYIGSFNTKE